jgi:hypothetical protein
MSVGRSALSPLLWNYIEDLICKNLIEEALKCTCHVARVRSIAYAAGFCAYYARIIGKMGVLEAIKENVPGKGKALHKTLALAFQNRFSKYSLADIMKDREVIKEVSDEAPELLNVQFSRHRRMLTIIGKFEKSSINIVGQVL